MKLNFPSHSKRTLRSNLIIYLFFNLRNLKESQKTNSIKMYAKTKKVFKVVFATLFVDLLAFTLILPLLPKILDYYATNDTSGTYRLFNNNVKLLQSALNVPESYNQVLLAGILGSWFSLLQFVSSPFFGALSDKFGRKPIIILATLGSIVSYMIWFCSSNNFATFILFRTIGGLCKANVGLSLAIVSDVSDDNSRGKGMAIVGSSFSLAFILGPSLGAFLSTLAEGKNLQSQLITVPSMIATLLSAADLILLVLFLEETNSTSQYPIKNSIVSSKQIWNQENIISKAFHYINPKSLFSFKLVQRKTRSETIILNQVGLIYFYYLLFYSGLEFTLSFLTHIKFNFTPRQQGYLYLFSGSLMALIQGGYIRRMKGGKESRMAMVGLTTIVPSFIFMGLSSSVLQICLSLALYSFASAIVVPCLTTIISSHSPVESRGAVMGTFRSIGSLARAIGPFIASFLFWTLGPNLSYTIGALALILPLYKMRILVSLLHTQKEKESTKYEPSQVTKKTIQEVAKAN